MSDAYSKAAVPTWIKFVAATAAVLLVGAIVLIGACIWLYNATIKTDAADVKKNVDSIVTFKHPLSADYIYKLSIDVDFAGIKVGVIQHKPDKVNFVLARVPYSEKN